MVDWSMRQAVKKLMSKGEVTSRPVNLAQDARTGPVNVKDVEKQAIEALRTCFDPEIPVNIYELGLIYGVTVNPSGQVGIRMTLTSPFCPVAASLPAEAEEKVRAIPGVTGAKVEVVFDPPWDPSRMSEAAKLQLGLL
jgi:FeS assembly SUF system protein